MPAMRGLIAGYESIIRDKKFWEEYYRELAEFAGRPTPLTYASRLTKKMGGARIFLKREDLLHHGCSQIEQHGGPDPACQEDG